MLVIPLMLSILVSRTAFPKDQEQDQDQEQESELALLPVPDHRHEPLLQGIG